MSNEYDQITAGHYRSYRPPLHEIILEKGLGQKEKYTLGLDIGCGCGHSSNALLQFCEHVIGIDPSSDMLENAMLSSAIEYQNYDGQTLKFADNHFDIITFAGSLYYAKSQNLLDEVVRVGKPSATILIYDFGVLLDDIFKQITFDPGVFPQSDYNHQENFSGLRNSNVNPIKTAEEETYFQISSNDLVHLFLSVKGNYMRLGNEYGFDSLHETMVNRLGKIVGDRRFGIKAHLYYSVYTLVK